MIDRRRRMFVAGALGASAAWAATAGADASAQGSGHGLPPAATPAGLSQDEKWRRRFPQPVLVSDLIGRLVIDRDQGVLGRIETLVEAPGGTVQIVYAKRSWLFFGGTAVAVPAKATALLGKFVMVLDLSGEELGRLPAWTAGAPAVDRASRIDMGLTKH